MEEAVWPSVAKRTREIVKPKEGTNKQVNWPLRAKKNDKSSQAGRRKAEEVREEREEPRVHPVPFTCTVINCLVYIVWRCVDIILYIQIYDTQIRQVQKVRVALGGRGEQRGSQKQEPQSLHLPVI